MLKVMPSLHLPTRRDPTVLSSRVERCKLGIILAVVVLRKCYFLDMTFDYSMTDSGLSEGDTFVLSCRVRKYSNIKPNVTVALTDDTGRNLTSEVHSSLDSDVLVQHRVRMTSSQSRPVHCTVTAFVVAAEVVSKTLSVTLNVPGEFSFFDISLDSLSSFIRSSHVLIY